MNNKKCFICLLFGILTIFSIAFATEKYECEIPFNEYGSLTETDEKYHKVFSGGPSMSNENQVKQNILADSNHSYTAYIHDGSEQDKANKEGKTIASQCVSVYFDAPSDYYTVIAQEKENGYTNVHETTGGDDYYIADEGKLINVRWSVSHGTDLQMYIEQESPMAEKISKLSNDYEKKYNIEKNTASDKFSVENGKDSTIISCHSIPAKSSEIDFDENEVREYVKIFTISELPDVYYVLTYKESEILNYSGHIQLRDFVMEKGENAFNKTRQNLRNKNFGNSIMNLKYRIEWSEPYLFKENKNNNSTTNYVTQKEENFADVKKGEVKGENILTAIIVGVAATALAVGTALNEGSKDDGEANQKRYAMYIGKDFGDGINLKGEPVEVYARMVEIDKDGKETPRPDLTEKIVASTTGDVEFVSQSFINSKCVAKVKAKSEPKKYKGDVLFKFRSEAGEYINATEFRIVDKPELLLQDGDVFKENTSMGIISGDNETYKVKMFIRDAVTEPKKIEFSKEDNFDITYEKAEEQMTYYIIIKNKTPAIEKKLLNKIETDSITVRAIFDDNTETEGNIYLDIYPEGLSAVAEFEDDKLNVKSYEKEEYGGLDSKFYSYRIKLILTKKSSNEEERIIKLNNNIVKFEKLKPSDESTKNILAKYEYRISSSNISEGYIDFCPLSNLNELGNPYFITLPIVADYNGNTETLEIPIRLRGIHNEEMKNYEEEYKQLIRRINMFVPEQKKESMLKEVEERFGNHKTSAATLRAMSVSIVKAYNAYWTNQQEEDQAWADALDWAVWGLEWSKWFGDIAFSIVAATYAGPVGEAIITPCKEIFVNLMGEIGVDLYYGKPFDLSSLSLEDNIAAIGDNVFTNAVTSAPNPKAIAQGMAMYLCYALLKNYLANMAKTGESDLYGATIATFKDLTLVAMKSLGGELFKKWMKNQKVYDYVGKYMGDSAKRMFIKNVKEFAITKKGWDTTILANADNLSDELVRKITSEGLLEKFVSEIFGAGVAKVYDKAVDSEFSMSDSSDIIFTFNLWEAEGKDPIKCRVNVSKILESPLDNPMFGIAFDYMFGSLPFADAVKEISKDPAVVIS